jgi:hypothetical protein
MAYTQREQAEIKALSDIMNVKCRVTGEQIQVGETVRVFDWNKTGLFLGYGRFTWDADERRFCLLGDTELNQHTGMHFHGIEDGYDAFVKAGVEKVTETVRADLLK